MTDKVLKTLWEKVKSHFIAHYENGSAKIIRDVFGYTIDQIEKEDVFVLTKEELEKVYKAGEDSKENEINGDGETDFNDWINTQKP